MMSARPLPKSWWRILTSWHAAPIFGRIWLSVAALALYAAVAVMVDRRYPDLMLEMHAGIHTLLGLVLGLLLVFRTNTAYDRWWEGRKLWGALVNESRNLAIKLRTCVSADAAEKSLAARQLVSFSMALKQHLRDGARLGELDGFHGETAQPAHVPAYIARTLYQHIEGWKQREQLGGFELLFLDRHAAALMDICGACERIRNTPISASWRWFIRQSIALYLLTLPWGLLDEFGWWTVPALVVTGYFMIGIEMIAEAVEEPFGHDADDLALDEICRGIGRSVEEIMSFADAPVAAVRPPST